MATIWDADVLIWAASQIVEARDAGLRTSRLMAATPYEILTFIGRGTSARDYHRLKAALDRLQSTTVATSLRQTSERRMHRFSWINEWTERADAHGSADGIDLIVPDWFYRARPRRRARADHRPRIFRADRRPGALALSPRPQARRPAARRLAVRFPASPRQVGEPFAVQTLRLRAARHRAPPAAAGLPARRRRASRRPRAARLRARRLIHRVLWTTCGSARAIGNREARAIRNRTHVLSGTGSAIFIKQINRFRAA